MPPNVPAGGFPSSSCSPAPNCPQRLRPNDFSSYLLRLLSTFKPGNQSDDMNRIQHLVEDDTTTTLSPPMAVDLAGGLDNEPQDAHCIITPLHYERNYAYPLIVWLHGPDDDERQVTRVMPHVSTRNYA